MTDLMTDFINRRKSLEETCSEKLQQFKKLYKKKSLWHQWHYDTDWNTVYACLLQIE